MNQKFVVGLVQMACSPEPAANLSGRSAVCKKQRAWVPAWFASPNYSAPNISASARMLPSSIWPSPSRGTRR